MVKEIERKIPKGYLYVDKDFRTVSIRDKKTGRMMGRRAVRGRGDSTAILRVKKGVRAGEIWGRTRPIKIRQHRRTSKKGKTHTVIKHRRRR